jgi:hypothetical protein
VKRYVEAGENKESIASRLRILWTEETKNSPPFVLGKQFVEIALVDGHIFSQKRLQVENILTAIGNPVLVEGRRLDDLMLEGVVQILHKLQREGLDDDVGGDAVDE